MKKYQALLAMLALLVSNTSLADDAGERWPDLSLDDIMGSVHRVKVEGQARGDANANTGFDTRTAVAIGAAATATAGVTYGVGRRIAYTTALREAEVTAAILKRETLKSLAKIQGALEPELQRYGAALLKANAERLGEGAAQLSADELEAALLNGLKSPETRGRLLTRLRAGFGDLAEIVLTRIYESRAIRGMVGEISSASQMGKLFGLEKWAAKVGESMARTAAKELAPIVGRYAARAAVATAVTAVRGGLIRRCLTGIGRIGMGAVEVAGSAWTAGILLLLDSSTADAATLDGMYANNPEALLNLPEPEIRRWLQSYPHLRRRLAPVIEVMEANGDLSTNESVAPPAEAEEIAACFTDAAQPAPVLMEPGRRLDDVGTGICRAN